MTQDDLSQVILLKSDMSVFYLLKIHLKHFLYKRKHAKIYFTLTNYKNLGNVIGHVRNSQHVGTFLGETQRRFQAYPGAILSEICLFLLRLVDVPA